MREPLQLLKFQIPIQTKHEQLHTKHQRLLSDDIIVYTGRHESTLFLWFWTKLLTSEKFLQILKLLELGMILLPFILIFCTNQEICLRN